MVDFQALLHEINDQPPCGPDLTYDNDFQAMESAARGKAEQQFGDTVIPANPPDWRDVERQALALMHRTKDLRVAVLLCRAWTKLRGLSGTAAGLQLCTGLLERYWEHLYPLPEEGDDYFMRMNALGTLEDVTGFMRDLRDSEFLRGTFGQVRVRDAEALAKGQISEDLPSLSADELRSAISVAGGENYEPIQVLQVCLRALQQLQHQCDQRLPNHQRPDLSGLSQLLHALELWMPVVAVSGSGAVEISAKSTGLNPQANEVSIRGSYQDRQQAIALLLEIAVAVERVEPANPAPLFIRRAAKLMRMNFLEILKELSPESVSQIETLTGRMEQP